MALREDSDPYCLLWVGVLLLSTYYFHFLYLTAVSLSVVVQIAAFLLPLLAIPLLLVFTFIGFLRPERGKTKATMMSLSVVLVVFHWIFSNLAQFLLNPNSMIEATGLAAWGVGSALLVAGGFSIMQPISESEWQGLLDVKKLHYGPPKEHETIEQGESTPAASPES